MINTLHQRERRKTQSLFGASELTTGSISERNAADKEQCSENFQTIGLSNCCIKDVFRIGKLKGDMWLLRVPMVNEKNEQFLIANSKKLRHDAKLKKYLCET